MLHSIRTISIGILLMRLLVNAQLNCDGIEWRIGSAGDYAFNIAGMCRGSFGSYQMFVCDPSGDDYWSNTYNNSDCSGPPISNYSYSFVEQYINLFGITDYNITCCSGNQCNYAKVSGYRIDGNTCNKTDDISFWNLYPTDNCAADPFIQCKNGSLTMRNAMSGGDCTGNATSVDTMTNGQCGGFRDGVFWEVECGLSAIDTCPDPTPMSSETIQEANNTESPLFSTTMFNADGCSRDKECGFGFICVDGSCIRDCNAFDIEGYLQCSSTFANVEYDIMQINSGINMIDINILNISSKLNMLDQRSYVNEWAIGSINDEIEELQIKLNDTNDKIDRFSVNPNVPFSAQSIGNGLIDNPFNPES